MRLLYVTIENFDDESIDCYGITKKILGQVVALQKLGFEVDYIGRMNDEIILFSNNGNEVLFNCSGSNYIDFSNIEKEILSFIKNKKYNVLYTRYSATSSWNTKKLYKKCRNGGVKVFLEVPTYPYKEEMCINVKAFLNFIVSEFFNLWMKKYITSIVAFGEFDTIMGVSVISIKNGIDMTKIPITRNNSEKTLRLVAMGSLKGWQGYDRLLEGLAAYYNCSSRIKREIHVDVIGDGLELEHYRKIVRDNNLHKYVNFHGKKGGALLDTILSSVHIGINSLGCHRKGVKELSTLKSKEFLARGLPIVYSTYENCLSEDLYFCKKIPENDFPVDIDEIISFYDEVAKHKNYPETIRSYAESTVSWDLQMKKIFRHLQ